MHRFQIIALSPPGLFDPAIAIAASRAGEIGILDLEYVRKEEAARAALGKLALYARNSCGVRLDAGDDEFFSRLIGHLPEQTEYVILTGIDFKNLSGQVEALRGRNITVLWESKSLDQALQGVDAGVDGLIAKGNEAAGWVGQETAFILLQRLLRNTSLRVWAQGGIGSHSAAGCYAAGAAGVVVDSQLLLTRESAIPHRAKATVAGMDGSETVCLGEELGTLCRVYAPPGFSTLTGIRKILSDFIQNDLSNSEKIKIWKKKIGSHLGWEYGKECLWFLGQDIGLAKWFAQRFLTVGGVLEGIRQSIDTNVAIASNTQPFNEASPLAQSHGTRYPIVQGPMARVSDRASFVAKVADAGALPFLALSSMGPRDIEGLLGDAQKLLGNRPWGVGILGFLSSQLRQEQFHVIRRFRPPFAIIAGARPAHVKPLEQEGIRTYVHVPSPGLLKMFIEAGTRRFIFEGRECGGHVGPRSSFVLWNAMTDVLLECVPAGELADCHVLFAGGIHDELSSCMVAAIAAPLAEKGVRVGILMGTAYLFTEEAVSTGALLEGFQKEALRCKETALLETGPGHAIRCAMSPYVEKFNQEKRLLLQKERQPDEVRKTLEEMNLGRLRIASKGVKRNPECQRSRNASVFITLGEEKQRSEGLYMIGQLAALRDETCTMEGLHQKVSLGGSRRLAELEDSGLSCFSTQTRESPCEIAIIGMACLVPKAPGLQSYWENIINKVSAITEVPEDRWDWRLYFDPDSDAQDKFYSKWGGFLDPVPFDPIQYGMPPNSLRSIEPLQLLTLETVAAALRDAGYENRPFARERTSVIIGASGGLADLGQYYAFRAALPTFFEDVPEEVLSQLPKWTEDSFPGTLANVIAGRVANRFDFGGVNYSMDAACASSMAAIHSAMRELENRASDMVLVGGADTFQNPHFFFCFAKTHALSPTGRCRTFDKDADGTCISESVAVVALKRLVDAERDGDRIYGVIKGVGGSSDGRHKGLTAPHPEGQARALNRAYAKADISPATVGLIEAHGTGTVAGDRSEIETLKQVFQSAGACARSCALGSVKSMIGHTKSAAGVAGLIKVALALHHKVLPPTIGVDSPNPSLTESPFYVNTEVRPWIHGSKDYPRRACTSAFGFGGTNFHAVIEEYTGNFLDFTNQAVSRQWQSEIILLTAPSREGLIKEVNALDESLEQGGEPELADLACTLWQKRGNAKKLKLAIVAQSLDDLRQKLKTAQKSLKESGDIWNASGIYFTERPLAKDCNICFLFPGQGSQHPDMLRELAIYFSEVRKAFELADRVLEKQYPKFLSSYVFPPPCFSKEEELRCQKELTQTNIAQAALSAAAMGVFRLLEALNVSPNMVAGHSSGEYVALCASGVYEEEDLYRLTEARGRFIVEMAGDDTGTMVAVKAGRREIEDVIKSIEQVWVANVNAPTQTIISGRKADMAEAVRRLENEGMQVRPIPVSCAFHSPLVVPARDRLAEFISTIHFAKPKMGIFSNTTADLYPQDPEEMKVLLSKHLISPVEFTREVEQMYDTGARIFIEVGPRNVLTGLTGKILGERTHLAVAVDKRDRTGLLQLHHVLAQLATHGVPLELDRFYRGRGLRLLNLGALVKETKSQPLSSTTWMITGGRAVPLKEAHGSEREEKSPRRVRVKAPNLRTKQEAGSLTMAKKTGSNHLSQAGTQRPCALRGSRSSSNEVDRVMLEFQQVMGRFMERFLETQQEVMKAYLGRTRKSAGLASGDFSAASLEKMTESTLKELDQVRGELESGREVDDVGEAESQRMEERPAATSEERSGRISPAGIDREELTKNLVQIVSERTGYPQDMIDLDLDLDAELGIDSIKWVEILGKLQQSYLNLSEQQAQAAMEELSEIATLRGVIDWFTGTSGPGRQTMDEMSNDVMGQQETSNRGSAGADSSVAAQTLPRFVLSALDIPLEDSHLQVEGGSVFIVTDDERGIARSVADELKALGARVALVGMGKKVKKRRRNIYTADLSAPEQVDELARLVRRKEGEITGVIHLLPLRVGKRLEEMDLKQWQMRLREEVKSLFYLAKACGEDLRRTAKTKKAHLLTATGMGGTFGAGMEMPRTTFAGHGGLAGIVKTLALEWPDVRCQVVDLDPTDSISRLAGYVLREMGSEDANVEVGYTEARRLAPVLKQAPLDIGMAAVLTMDSSWVVLAIGGARGITAEATLGLAKRYKPTILVAGRSPLPEEEPPETAALTSTEELKAALIERMRHSKGKPTPRQVDDALKQVQCNREIHSNLAAMQEAGARVKYYQVDVRDEEAFGNVIEEICQEYGRLDGLIHGAGVIEDKLIEDKTADSFDRVFDTKVDSAFVLSKKLPIDSVKFLVLFSSIAGRFGNWGQSDYAAANEVLNKLAVYLDSRWPGRVVAINWNPWAKAGMATAEALRQFAEQGIQAIEPSAGRRMLDEELGYGRKGQAEVVIGDGPWNRAASTELTSTHIAFPLLHGTPLKVGYDHGVEVVLALDPERDRYLQDHRIDGKAVFPFAVAMELMSEVVQQGWPELVVTGIQSARRFQGIVLDGEGQKIRVVAKPQCGISAEQGISRLDVTIAGLNQDKLPYYSATVEVGNQLPLSPEYNAEMLSRLQPFPMSADEAYKKWLFHGPCFQGISKVDGFNDKGISAVLLPSVPSVCLNRKVDSPWLIDPVVIDSAFQLSILWERAHYDMTFLISRVGSYRRFGSFSNQPVRCWAEMHAGAGGHLLSTNFRFVDERGKVIALIEEMEGSCSKELNRIVDHVGI